jgi:hypothetical protein
LIFCSAKSHSDTQHHTQNNHVNHNSTSSYHSNETYASGEKSNKNAKKVAAIENSIKHTFLRNMTISDDFMKWCHDQLKDIHNDCNK